MMYPPLGFRSSVKHARLQPAFKQPVVVGNISTSFPEPSGMARSTLPANYGKIWIEQDSGGPVSFTAVNMATAAVVESWVLQGIANTDFEDCASCRIGESSFLYMGDIGNNANTPNQLFSTVPGLKDTSATSKLIATGSQVFTTGSSFAFTPGVWVRAFSNAGAANYMQGTVTSVVGNQLTINVINVGGSGTFADWQIYHAVDLIIYRCPEPTLTGSGGNILSGTIETIRCQFAINNVPALRDVECLLVDPDTGDIYLITKRIFPAQVYKLTQSASYGTTLQFLTYMGKLACATSATPTTIGTGSHTFDTHTGGAVHLQFPVGMRVRMQSRASQSNFMEGVVTSRVDTPGAETITIYSEVNTPTLTVADTGGSGTNLTDWDITLPITQTSSGNNGCVTGGTISPSATGIILVNYQTMLLWTRSKNETIYAALSRAPVYLTGAPAGNSFVRTDATPVPGLPQRECCDFGDAAGNQLFSCSEWIAASARGANNPLLRHDRVMKPATVVRLQDGLNGYSGTLDNFNDSTTPATSFGTVATGGATAKSMVSDTDPNPFVTTPFSGVTTAAGGTQSTFAVTTATNFAVGRLARISAQSVGTNYIGTWEVKAVSGNNITLDVPFSGNPSGTIAGHTRERQGFLKFDISSIPAGSTIVDAVVRLFINTEGASMALHRMKVTWSEADSFGSFGAVAPDLNVKAVAAPDHLTLSGMDTFVGFHEMQVNVATVQGWLDGTFSNFGWLVIQNQNDTGGNGYQWDSRESDTQTRKPMLIVTYTAP